MTALAVPAQKPIRPGNRFADKNCDCRFLISRLEHRSLLRPGPRGYARSVGAASSVRADMIFGKDKFTMNVWGAPERVRPAHLANERAQISRDLRSANMVARSPAPIRSKPSAVPANDRLWPDNRNRAKDGGEPVIKPNKQKTIGIVEARSFRCPPAKHIDLLP